MSLNENPQSRLTLVDVRRVSLFADLATLLLFIRSLGSWLGRCFLRSLRALSLFGRSLGGSRGGSLASGGSGFGGHWMLEWVVC